MSYVQYLYAYYEFVVRWVFVVKQMQSKIKRELRPNNLQNSTTKQQYYLATSKPTETNATKLPKHLPKTAQPKTSTQTHQPKQNIRNGSINDLKKLPKELQDGDALEFLESKPWSVWGLDKVSICIFFLSWMVVFLSRSCVTSW